MKRYSVIYKAQSPSPTNNTNIDWAGGQIIDKNMNYNRLEDAISCGRKLAKQLQLNVGEIRIADKTADMPYQEAKAFEFSGTRKLIQ